MKKKLIKKKNKLKIPQKIKQLKIVQLMLSRKIVILIKVLQISKMKIIQKKINNSQKWKKIIMLMQKIIILNWIKKKLN